jgi:beta-N-acetylhexosaminidase
MRLWRPTFLPYATEGGGGTAFPFNMGVAATGDPKNAEIAGKITALDARAVGIQWLFAPVADVNSRPENPIVNVRSYSSDATTVGTYVASFIRGAHEGHTLTTVKHFPGHGDTETDSHLELPVLTVTRARLNEVELVPFKAAVQSGVDAIMTGHLAVPGVIGDSAPATVAPAVGTLLRRDLAFSGLIITDAMTMGALRKLPDYSPGEIAVRAVEAGADVVLSPPDAEQAHAALVAAVRSNRISAARIDSSVARILGAKAHLGLQRQRFVSLDSVNRVVASPEHERAAAEIAAQSITLARDSAGLIPLDPRRTRSLTVIAFSAPNDVNAGRVFAAELRRVYGDVQFFRLDESLDAARYNDAVAAASRSDAIIFATFLMPISGQGNIHVPARAADLAQRIHAVNRPVVTVSFGDPYGPAQLPTALTYLLAWQPRAEHAQVAAARALAGSADITGVLPIDLPGAARGSGIRRRASSSSASGLRDL